MIGGGHGAVDCKIKESGGNGIAYMVGAVAAAGTAAGGASPLHAGDGAAGGEQEQQHGQCRTEQRAGFHGILPFRSAQHGRKIFPLFRRD